MLNFEPLFGPIIGPGVTILRNEFRIFLINTSFGLSYCLCANDIYEKHMFAISMHNISYLPDTNICIKEKTKKKSGIKLRR